MTPQPKWSAAFLFFRSSLTRHRAECAKILMQRGEQVLHEEILLDLRLRGELIDGVGTEHPEKPENGALTDGEMRTSHEQSLYARTVVHPE